MKPSQRAASGIDRRAFLFGGGALVGLAGAGFAIGCAPSDDAALVVRLRSALREAAFDARGAKLLSAAGEMSPAVALRVLRRGVSDRRLYTTAASATLLRGLVESRCEDDLRAGRVRRVRGWWLAETEVAVAVILAG